MNSLAFQPILAAARSARNPATMAGFAIPDFDAPAPVAATDPAADAAVALAATLAAAEATGFAAGEAAAQQAAAVGHAAREAAALEAVAAALQEGSAAAAAASMEAAEALAGLLLGALDAALPEAAARLAPDAAARLATLLRPLVEEGVAVTLRVAPGLAAAVASRLAAPGLALTGIAITEDPALPPGDASAAWRGGGAALSLAARRQAVADLLDTFELTEA